MSPKPARSPAPITPPRDRPSPAVHELVVRACRNGNRLSAAFGLAGIPGPVWRTWLDIGAREVREPTDPALGDLRTLAEDVAQATAHGEARLLERVTSASVTDWRAAMAVLERRHPEAWAAKIQIEVDRELTRALEAIEEVVDHETFERIVERLARLADRGDRFGDLEREAHDTTREVATALAR